ncbi:hypothetical protein CGZ69_27695 [Streptomyces peucetius subsp. caesius ATCC 27952]|nr:hypothetical protein CGZ69_27695 [Streptomyces peucetius subsp. caesius ATCC 27952]
MSTREAPDIFVWSQAQARQASELRRMVGRVQSVLFLPRLTLEGFNLHVAGVRALAGRSLEQGVHSCGRITPTGLPVTGVARGPRLIAAEAVASGGGRYLLTVAVAQPVATREARRAARLWGTPSARPEPRG